MIFHCFIFQPTQVFNIPVDFQPGEGTTRRPAGGGEDCGVPPTTTCFR